MDNILIMGGATSKSTTNKGLARNSGTLGKDAWQWGWGIQWHAPVLQQTDCCLILLLVLLPPDWLLRGCYSVLSLPTPTPCLHFDNQGWCPTYPPLVILLIAKPPIARMCHLTDIIHKAIQKFRLAIKTKRWSPDSSHRRQLQGTNFFLLGLCSHYSECGHLSELIQK